MSKLEPYFVVLFSLAGALVIVAVSHWWNTRHLRKLEASYRRFEQAFARGDLEGMARERDLQERLQRRTR